MQWPKKIHEIAKHMNVIETEVLYGIFLSIILWKWWVENCPLLDGIVMLITTLC